VLMGKLSFCFWMLYFLSWKKERHPKARRGTIARPDESRP
jgi:hypothetical protein